MVCFGSSSFKYENSDDTLENFTAENVQRECVFGGTENLLVALYCRAELRWSDFLAGKINNCKNGETRSTSLLNA